MNKYMVKLSKGASRIYGEAAFEVLAKAQELERQGKKILHFEMSIEHRSILHVLKA